MATAFPSSFFERIAERLPSTIYADTSNPHQLSVGLIGGDIPVFPPLAMLLATLLGFLAWRINQKRYRFMPNTLQPLALRVVFAAVFLGTSVSLANAAEEELNRVGTIPNFSTVSKVASQGPFAWSRNSMYLGLFLAQLSLAVGFDTAWLLASLVTTMVYLDRVVVPAEELFLSRELGVDYQQYCETVPRWLF